MSIFEPIRHLCGSFKRVDSNSEAKNIHICLSEYSAKVIAKAIELGRPTKDYQDFTITQLSMNENQLQSFSPELVRSMESSGCVITPYDNRRIRYEGTFDALVNNNGREELYRICFELVELNLSESNFCKIDESVFFENIPACLIGNVRHKRIE